MTMSESKPTDLLAAAASELSAERTYCKGCGYSLHRLPQPRCPECGCDFDPDDSSTTTKERGERQRFRYATSCLAACITLAVMPIVLVLFTGFFFLDLTSVIGIVMARRLRRKPSSAGRWLAGLFGLYLGLSLWVGVATLAPGILPGTTRVTAPVLYLVPLVVWSTVNLTLWHAWERAKRG